VETINYYFKWKNAFCAQPHSEIYMKNTCKVALMLNDDVTIIVTFQKKNEIMGFGEGMQRAWHVERGT
jgi:hypothetical protein